MFYAMKHKYEIYTKRYDDTQISKNLRYWYIFFP